METQNLPAIILSFVMVGMILGVGILTLDSFGPASSGRTTITAESATFTFNSTITLANGHVVSFTGITNSSGVTVPASNYSASVSGATVSVGNCTSCMGTKNGDAVTLSYIYDKYDSHAKTGTDNVVTAAGTISSTWLPLIVTIIALSVILLLVMRSFRGR